MIKKDYFLSLASYHSWATQRLITEGLNQLEDEQWMRNVGLFFGSIHRTLNHLMVAEEIWWARFACNQSVKIALDAQLYPERQAICAALTQAVQRWSGWLETIDESILDGQLIYKRNNQQVVDVPFASSLGHVFNHATHHRGQISAAMSFFECSCPELDWIYKLQQEQKVPSTS